MLANGVEGMTVSEVSGFGRQRGKSEVFRGTEYTIAFVPKVKVEIVVPTDSAETVVHAIAEAARTGKIGDGKIWRAALVGLLRIRNGDADLDAV